MKYAFLLAMLPSLAQADAFCDELWFTRNLIFDREGYCFGSALGQAVFDNADCTTSSPSLSANNAATVSHIKDSERWAECKTDTSRTTLDFPLAGWMRQLEDIPVRADGESGCIGHLGRPIPLYAGRVSDAAPILTLKHGDTIIWAHEDFGDWSYLTRPDGRGGWTFKTLIDTDMCESLAG